MSYAERLLTLTMAVSMMVSPGLVSCACEGPQFCTRELNPVCGTFQKTFSNPCELQGAICNLATQGFEYVSYNQGDCCDRACTAIYQPVIGCDGMTYSNACVMQLTACQEERCIYSGSSGPPLTMG